MLTLCHPRDRICIRELIYDGFNCDPVMLYAIRYYLGQHLLRQRLGAIRHQAIVLTNVDSHKILRSTSSCIFTGICWALQDMSLKVYSRMAMTSPCDQWVKELFDTHGIISFICANVEFSSMTAKCWSMLFSLEEIKFSVLSLLILIQHQVNLMDI